jgi:dipeptidase
MRQLKTSFAVMLIFFMLKSTVLFSCTVIVVGKDASSDGSVIISHTDCGDDCRIRVVEGQNFAPGTMAKVFWGIQDIDKPLDDFGEVLGEIPQVEKTYTYFHSAYSHMNEHQLAIAESTTSQRSDLCIKKGESKQIMTVEQAQIFALQRCKTAEEALTLITSLMDKYGFLPSCADESETLVIADPNEAWVLELCSVGPGWDPESKKPGAIWAAQRVPDDHALMIPNWSIIKEIKIEDEKNFRASKNYKSFAIEKGWYNPKSGKPFIWQDVYAPIPREWATGRFWLFYSTVAPNYTNWPDRYLNGNIYKGINSYYQYVEPLSLYPFSLKPEKKISVQDVMGFQRSVFEGTIYDKTADPDWYVMDKKGNKVKSPLATPFPTKHMRALLDISRRRNVARPQGRYGMVAQLRSWLPAPIGGIYWVFLDNAHISAYAPIYAGAQDVADCYKLFDPDKFDEKSARWAIDFIDNLLYLNWQEGIKDVKAVRDPFEEKLFNERDEIDKKALELYNENPEKAKKFLTNYTIKNMNTIHKMFSDLRGTLIVKYTNNRNN